MPGFVLCVATAATAAQPVAVLPVEPRKGVLSEADAAAATAEIRAAAGEALAPHGVEVIAAQGTAAAALEAGAAAALFGRAASLEGATVISIGVYKPGASAPAAMARIVGIGADQLRADIRAKIPKLILPALGLAATTPEPGQPRGTLRMPVPVEQAPTAPAPAPAAAPEPATPAAAPAPAAPPANEAPMVTLIREVTSEVEALRGLRRKQTLKILILDDTLFTQALHEKARKELTPALVAAERARWTAFALAPAGLDPGEILLNVLDEQVAGFYDPFSRQLIVRKEPQGGAEELRVVLAHEIEHALQDQNFGLPDFKTLPDDDVRLARTALFEGDAMAVMSAYSARRAHKPVKAAILGGAAMLRAVDTEALLRMSGKSPALMRAPAILREELVLPYSAGFALVAEVYRRGGFALVNKMFAHPPQSSHQLLHPDAYFAGEQPVALPFPPAPVGTRIVASGRMGELGVRVALEVCVDRAVARDFAQRSEGDAYTIVEGPRGKLSLLWTSAWSAGAPAQVVNLMELEQPCWEESGLPGAAKVGAAGDLVAVSRGVVDLDAAQARQLAVHARQPPPSPPLGDVPPPPPPEPARVEDGKFVSPRLALSGEVPEGYAQETADGTAELSIRREKAGSASLSLVQEPLAGDALETFFEHASAQVAAAQGGRLALLDSRARPLLGAARALERTWSIEGTQAKLRIDVAAWCSGKAALALIRVENGFGAQEALERFALSIKSTGAAPACADLQ